MTIHTRRKVKHFLKALGVTLFAFLVLCLFLMPFGYGLLSSLKTKAQIANVDAPLIPSVERTYTTDQAYTVTLGKRELKIEEGTEDFVYNVPLESGEIRQLAMIHKTRNTSWFVDPKNPDAGPIEWKGKWRTLEPIWKTEIQWGNYTRAWQQIKFLRLLRNTTVYAILSTIGAVCSAAVVAYGFARFDFPKKNILFILAVSTIILPPAVFLIPRYFVFYKIGWIGTWLPIIIPQYFSNGWNIFLLRQFFMGIPREMEEAAKIDGAGPIKTFLFVILPQSVPALVAVTLFHFFYCWNDFLEPLVYLAGNPTKFPISIGLTLFNRQFTQQTELIQAASVMGLAIPVIIFFFAQRFFMQGVVITGVEK
jgi:multiple sugar transport system permease protein